MIEYVDILLCEDKFKKNESEHWLRVNIVGVKSKSYNLECFVTVFVGVNE